MTNNMEEVSVADKAHVISRNFPFNRHVNYINLCGSVPVHAVELVHGA
jgi:hypothetical protein